MPVKNILGATAWHAIGSLLLKESDKKERTPFTWINSSNISQPIEASKNIFISGCSENEAKYLDKNGFDILRSSKEAWLSLDKNHFDKRSLRSVIKAGCRNGEVEEIFFSRESCGNFERLKNCARYSNKPQIKFFFDSTFTSRHRLFVFKTTADRWLGALLLSEKSDSIKTELILRDNSAPNGVMEALIFKTFYILKSEGYNEWSLGEVPFVIRNSRYFSKEFLLNFFGRRLSFAYNYKGLFFFKNKFNPEWKDVYICSYPALNFRTLAKISWMSNLAQLVIWQVLASIF